jgi:hypothetical protein
MGDFKPIPVKDRDIDNPSQLTVAISPSVCLSPVLFENPEPSFPYTNCMSLDAREFLQIAD